MIVVTGQLYLVKNPRPMRPQYGEFRGKTRAGFGVGYSETFGAVYLGRDQVLFRTLPGEPVEEEARARMRAGDNEVRRAAEVLARALVAPAPPTGVALTQEDRQRLCQLFRGGVRDCQRTGHPGAAALLEYFSWQVGILHTFATDPLNFERRLPVEPGGLQPFFSILHRDAQASDVELARVFDAALEAIRKKPRKKATDKKAAGKKAAGKKAGKTK